MNVTIVGTPNVDKAIQIVAEIVKRDLAKKEEKKNAS